MTPGPAPAVGLYVHIPFCEAKCTYCHFAIDPRSEWAAPLAEVAQAGLVETRGERLVLTDRGVLLSNEVFEIFV